MGSIFPPRGLEGDLVTPAMRASEQVEILIRWLSSLAGDDATRALYGLLSDNRLSQWCPILERARDRQRIIHRDAHYRHLTVEEVRQTLNNGAPAKAADLAAVLVDRLGHVADRIRTGNANDWRQYWNEGVRGRLESPKIEEHCRDALLSDLRVLLPDGVDAQPEGHYANATRADIRASYGEFNVLVEIKRDRHRELWNALRDQLMALYTSNPATGGHGIYLVFWFGDGQVQSPPLGSRPTNRDELKEFLAASLTESERRRISILVVDVSPVGR